MMCLIWYVIERTGPVCPSLWPDYLAQWLTLLHSVLRFAQALLPKLVFNISFKQEKTNKIGCATSIGPNFERLRRRYVFCNVMIK